MTQLVVGRNLIPINKITTESTLNKKMWTPYSRSKQKIISKDCFDLRVKKMLKEAQAKRTQITKECSHLSKVVEKLEEENLELKSQVR